MRKYLLFLLFIGASLSLKANNDVEVWIYSDKNWTDGMVKIEEGRYTLLGDNKVLNVFDVKQSAGLLYFSFVKGKIKLTYEEKKLGSFEQVMLQKISDYGKFRIKVGEDERIYADNLRIQPLDGSPILINTVDLEWYVAGVVESEGGHMEEEEYLKAQAVIARTYVVGQMDRFSGMPYNLCDSQQCQVYKSLAYGKNAYKIFKSIYATKGLILADGKGNPITAAFHANSGGFTTNSEDAWSSELSYLRSIKDTFSLSGPSATWEATIDKEEWINYLAKSSPALKEDSALAVTVMSFMNPDRNPNLNVGGVLVPFKEIRKQFKLRSAYFDLFEKGDKLLLKGRGFGHGVGLSQDGAYRMAKNGYNYDEILSFYYKDVKLFFLR